MNRLFFFLLFLSISVSSCSQGKYAGRSLKKLVGTTYTNEEDISALKGYTYHGGTLISDINDPVQQLLTVFKKRKTGIVLYRIKDDTVTKVNHIVDVLAIKNIPEGWEIKTSGCQEGEAEGEIIVALVNPGKGEYAKAVKQAWRCNRDKIRFEGISVKNIKCVNEGGE